MGTFVVLTSGCAGSAKLPVDPTACAFVGGILGGAAGAVVAANTSEGETDERLVGAGIGAASGALIGSQLCGERAAPMPPVASIERAPGAGPAPLEVEFQARATDADGQVVGYAWDFGDGSFGEGPRVVHGFESPGSYTVKLLVTDDEGLRGSAETQVQVRVVAASRPAPPEPRKQIALRGIEFPFDSSEIDAENERILDAAVDQLQQEPDVRVAVIGYTDSLGSEDYNRELSERRARAVADYMIGQGIEGWRVRIEGRGELEPVSPNDQGDGRAHNRRVALEVVNPER